MDGDDFARGLCGINDHMTMGLRFGQSLQESGIDDDWYRI